MSFSCAQRGRLVRDSRAGLLGVSACITLADGTQSAVISRWRRRVRIVRKLPAEVIVGDMKEEERRSGKTTDLAKACPAFRSNRFLRSWTPLLVLIVISMYLVFPSCSSEQTRTVHVLHSILTDYLAANGTDVRVEKVRFGNPRHFTTSVLQQVPGRLEWPLRVPSGDPRLEFGVGFIFREGATPGGVVARVTVESEGTEEVLFSANFWANTENQHLDFHVQRIPLARYAGRPVRIVFESATSGRGVGDVDIIWATQQSPPQRRRLCPTSF